MPSRAIGLTLQLHGPPAVQFADGRELALEGRGAALVALVALESEPRRERIAALLWPDSDDPRRNLRQQLLRLKQALDGAALVEGDAVLRLAAGVALANGVDAAPLLGALQFDDSPDFQAWLDERRARQRDVGVQALEADAAAAEAAGRYDDALAAAQKLLALDAAAEAHHRLAMRLHYLRGDRAAGLAAYERLERWLQARHGLAPDAASQALARSLRESSTALVPRRPAAAAVPVTVMRPPRLIGRDDALTALRAAWDARRAALLLGEPGLGKSRLLAEFCADARVVGAAGRPGDAGVPYATLARLLRRLRDLHEPAHTPLQAAAMAWVLPEWAAASGTPPGDVRLALLAALEAWLVQAHQRGLTAIVLDDLHFADAASIEAVQTLIGSESLSGLRFALAARPGEIGGAGEALRTTLAEARLLDEVALLPLTVKQMTELVASLGLPELDAEALGPQLARHSGGNPLYALETLKLGLADGSLRNGALSRPQGVGVLIERRLKQLSEPALALARVAAIAGVDFCIELAEIVTGERAVQLAGAWQELDDAHVLRDEAFAHDLVADAALRSVPPAIARRVHKQCAQWLAERDVEPARVAWHWRLGGQARLAGQAFMRAAARAEQTARLAEEAEWYAQAAACFADADCEAERFEARLLRVRALRGTRFDIDGVREARDLHSECADDRQSMQVLSELSSLFVERGETDAAIEAGEAALAAARRLQDMEWQVRTACHLAATYLRQGRGQDAVAVLAPLKSWVEQQADSALRMLWFGDWGAVLGDQGRLREAIAAYDTALVAARAARLPDGEAQLLMNCAIALRRSGQFDRALSVARQGRAMCIRTDDKVNDTAIVRLVVARDEAEAGLFASALPQLEEVLAEFEQRAAAFWVVAVHTVLARLWLDLGQYARAMPLLRDDADVLPNWLRADRRLLRLELSQAIGQPAARGLLGECLALVGKDEARGPLMRVRALRHQPPEKVQREAPTLALALRSSDRFGGLMGLQLHQARAALALGRRDEGAAAARDLVALFDEGYAPDSVYRAEAWWVAHQALQAAGHHEAARDALGRGEQWLRQVALPQVPAPFLDSFLHRNPVNRAMLSAAAAASP